MLYDITLKAVVSYIETHIGEPLDGKVLAGVGGYGEDYFRRLFKSGTGRSLARYVRERRLSNAAFALRNSGRSVTDIAFEYGFASHEAFTRAFRQFSGYSPTDFRRSDIVVRGMMIVPGMMGPVILKKENDTMTTNNPSGDGVVLRGVPKVSYFNDPPELTPFIASLRACLTYAGQPISYARLLSGSGAAFRLMWNRNEWDGGNVDILLCREDPMEPIWLAFAAAGHKGKFLDKKSSNKAEMSALIREEINAGRPVIGFGVVGPPEACVITGYREDGEVLLGWSFFQDFPEFKGELEGVDPSGYFIRRGWYEHHDTLGVLAHGGLAPLPDEKIFLRDTLRLAVQMMEPYSVGPFAGGQAAFDEWERALLDESQFLKDAPLPMLMERMMCQSDAFTMVAEGRGYGGMFFKDEAEQFPEYSCELMEISSLLKQEHDAAWEMPKHHVSLGMGEPQAKALSIRDNRRAIAALIRKCKDLDARALGKIKALLEKF